MKKMKIVVLAVVAFCIMMPTFVQGAPADQPANNMQILRDKIKADKKLVVSVNMQMTEVEAKDFWPLYEAYQKDLGAINKRIGAMVNSYAEAWNTMSLNDEKAKKLTKEFLTIQADEVKLMKTYVAKLSKILPATKVARYLQIENKIRALIRYELAASIPLMENK
jgi:hypothetical protein